MPSTRNETSKRGKAARLTKRKLVEKRLVDTDAKMANVNSNHSKSSADEEFVKLTPKRRKSIIKDDAATVTTHIASTSGHAKSSETKVM